MMSMARTASRMPAFVKKGTPASYICRILSGRTVSPPSSRETSQDTSSRIGVIAVEYKEDREARRETGVGKVRMA
jgi:hypothetical protein